MSDGYMNIIKKLLMRDGSISVKDHKMIESYIADPDFPFLISFPRTGSHWLRMIMELYFEKPSLVRIFYFMDANEFTCFHRHDEDLSITRKNVIYLYRNPVDTIYSQLKYYGSDFNDSERTNHWAALYGRHLSKWLLTENFTTQKTVITYEGLKKSMHAEFRKICDHFGAAFDPEKLDAILPRTTKKELKSKTAHDNQVVNLSEEYTMGREEYRNAYGKIVCDIVCSQNPNLRELFPDVDQDY